MSLISETGEFGFIDRIRPLFPTTPNVIEGSGDDCAVVRVGDRIQLVSTDAFVEDVHYRRAWISPFDVGWKAGASALSDIAAMGGRPEFVLTSIAIPEAEEVGYLEEVYRGIAGVVGRFGAALVGGDTTKSTSGLMIDVTVIGEAIEGRYLLRRGARTGDDLIVTGNPGRSRAGLLALTRGLDAPVLIEAHNHPAPRIVEGQWLAECGHVRAMMDVSDGIAQDAGHMARASGVGVTLDSASIGTDSELEAFSAEIGESVADLVFTGGEDYELAFAVDPAHSQEVVDALEKNFDLSSHIIGTFQDNLDGVTIDGQPKSLQGYDHFGEET